MDLNFCASTAIEFMHRHHTRFLQQLLPLLITRAVTCLLAQALVGEE